MKKRNLLAILIITLFTISTYSQRKKIEFGLKAGLNFSKHTKEIAFGEFKEKTGYYIGVLTNFNIGEKFKIQPEIQIALQGTKYIIGEIPDLYLEPNFVQGEAEVNTNELIINIPVLGQFYLTDKFYLEAGPQFGYILDSKDKEIKNTFDNPESNNSLDFTRKNYDKFDFGLSFGTGYKINEKLIINSRYFFGLLDRDGIIKSSVLNLGIEYKL
jgi:Outer membrane protein beta-barrel domain